MHGIEMYTNQRNMCAVCRSTLRIPCQCVLLLAMPGLSVRITGVAEEERPPWTSLCVRAKALAVLREGWLNGCLRLSAESLAVISGFIASWMLSI